jgi:ribonuclease HI
MTTDIRAPSKPVVIYTSVNCCPTRGAGGWGALLTYSEHRREIHGWDLKSTEGRLELQGVIEALQCLTRPVRVQVWIGTEHMVERVEDSLPEWQRNGWPTGGENIDLWRQLAAVADRHEVEWVLPEDADYENPDLRRAWALASEARKHAQAKLLETALEQFLADQREKRSERSFANVEGVIWTLRWGIDWYEGDKKYAILASEIDGQLFHFFRVLVHKEFARPSKLKAVKSVLPALLKWLQEQGHLDAAIATSLINRVKEEVDECLAIRKFIDALQSYIDEEQFEVDGSSVEERVGPEYLEIREIADSSIMFGGHGNRCVGPIAVPLEISRMAKSRWQILLSAARINGTWRLLDVANGDP